MPQGLESDGDKTADSRDTETKSESAVSPEHGSQAMRLQQPLSIPSALDEITSSLDSSIAPEFGTSSGYMGAAPGSGADDFSAMLGVSDIFDFDFDQDSSANAGGRSSPGATRPT